MKKDSPACRTDQGSTNRVTGALEGHMLLGYFKTCIVKWQFAYISCVRILWLMLYGAVNGAYFLAGRYVTGKDSDLFAPWT